MGAGVRISSVVAAALAGGQPVVALESTVFSQLGLPGPAGAEARKRVDEAVLAGGAFPALTVVFHFFARVVMDDTVRLRVLGDDRKGAERDLADAVAHRWPAAATIVSASVALVAAAGIRVFAIGGIGGVHRDWA